MTATRTDPRVEITTGSLEGRWRDDVAVFLGIPYAEAPTGERRWAPPVPAKPWDGVRSAAEPGPIPPQLPARLEAAMGPMQAPRQDEDCLNLNVWTPAPNSSERLPVLVFIHGGGYLSGAGSAAWYDGTVMARRGRIVVVTINYRLGALGYLYLDSAATGGAPVANLGLLDQRLALEWIHENAHAFGGDPGDITVFGQSGGGHSALGIAALPGTEGLFRRAILQSAPLGMPAASAERAGSAAAIFKDTAGVPRGDLAALRALPIDRILAAQGATLGRSLVFGSVEPPFQLVVDGHTLVEDPVAVAQRGSLDAVELLIGFTRDEATAFYGFDDRLWQLDVDAIAGRLAEQRGDLIAGRFRAYAAATPDRSAAAVLCDLVGDELFVAPAIRLAEARTTTLLWRFGWRSDAVGGRLGACHTIELPFVFANLEHWRDAPMLGGTPARQLEPLAEAVQDAWIAFARSGDPSHPGLPSWPAYDRKHGAALEFDLGSRVLDDPADGRRELWPEANPPQR